MKIFISWNFSAPIIEIAQAYAYFTRLSLLSNFTPWLCIYVLNNKSYE